MRRPCNAVMASDEKFVQALACGQDGAHPLGFAARATSPQFTIGAAVLGRRRGFGLAGFLGGATCATAQIRHGDTELLHLVLYLLLAIGLKLLLLLTMK